MAAAEVWALPNAKLKGIVATKSLGPSNPIADSVVLRFPGTTGWLECALWLPHGGGTLISCDALQNHADGEGTSFVGHFVTSLVSLRQACVRM